MYGVTVRSHNEALLKARVFHGAFWTVLHFGANEVIRLASNLILTRLLFPEAFGIMAIVNIFLAGVMMISDLGIRQSVIQSPRGNDTTFLNTAWTIQVFRGLFICLSIILLAPASAEFFQEPLLESLLPIAGLAAIATSLAPTAIYTANREIRIGRLFAINFTSQLIGVTLMIFFAIVLRTVWALAIGALIIEIVRTTMFWKFMPGARNRIKIESLALQEIFSFGKWIFLSTSCAFAIMNADRLIVGKLVSIEYLGIYIIGMTFAVLPKSLADAVCSSVVFPLYTKVDLHNELSARKVSKMRWLLTVGGVFLAAFLSIFGVAIIDTLYDPRYALAGPILVVLSIAIMPRLVLISYGSLLLAAGDSRRLFIITALSAILNTTFLFFGVKYFGIFGAAIAPALAPILIYPISMMFIERYNGRDPIHDIVMITLSCALALISVLHNFDEIQILFEVSKISLTHQ